MAWMPSATPREVVEDADIWQRCHLRRANRLSDDGRDDVTDQGDGDQRRELQGLTPEEIAQLEAIFGGSAGSDNAGSDSVSSNSTSSYSTGFNRWSSLGDSESSSSSGSSGSLPGGSSGGGAGLPRPNGDSENADDTFNPDGIVDPPAPDSTSGDGPTTTSTGAGGGNGGGSIGGGGDAGGGGGGGDGGGDGE
ncbi:unnamed protein product [Vitrella brassicaformis CCMP3155]|uniref:Uncharacterized protein n=1 Tax=Vitrella brassicaformis (strain CCMP3155) TaxID=1169540 RepID=A0A0G4EFN0_VITBC|nr:unnamed protein product [Vitrella brassicaformis CCMP3155]|eukprot:CEL94542.1 unnamed protein product [Vitrella brassicaformis CCMP3155]